MPRDGTRKQRAKQLIERLDHGPTYLDYAGGCSRQGYELWYKTWVRRELIALIPELKKAEDDRSKV